MRKIYHLMLLVIGLTLFNVSAQAQEKVITGTVVSDEGNAPISGVTVRVKGTTRTTQTNNSGQFSINASTGETLQFTHVGHEALERTVRDATVISVILKNSEKALGEVVVTAYGIKRSKRELTYQAITIDGDEVASTRRENFISSLAGRIPGALITQTTGMPGASASIVLRGPTSLDGSNQPIFVVDGLIIDNSAFEMQDRLPGGGGLNQANRNNDFGNRAMDINPADIESLTILKGPEATSLYGSDGANGAIIITTKKGKKGRASVNYNNSFRLEKVYRLPEIQTVYDQGTSGINNPLIRNYFGQKIPENTPRFDNIGSFFQTGFTQQHNISMDGGTDLSTFRFTASNVRQDGVVPNTGFERYNFRLNTTNKFGDKINLTNSFSYNSSRTDKASKGSGGFLLSLLSWPTTDDASVYLDANGNRKTVRGDLLGAEDDNPFWDVNRNISFDINDRFQGNFQLSYDVAKWLNLTAITGVDFYSTTGTWSFHPQSNNARTIGGLFQQYRENQKLINGAYRATIRKNYGKLNNTLIASFTFDKRKYEVNTIKGERMFDPTFVSINNVDPLTVQSLTTAENFHRFGNFLTYNGSYNKWLNISLSGRMDGSSRLVNPVKFNYNDALYVYWSSGMSFILSDLVKLPEFISFTKARINYATTGRDPRTPYVKANRFVPSPFTGGGFSPSVTQGNPSLRPEFTKQFETGAEMRFLKNRLKVDFAVYDNRTTDQLLNPRLSYATGAILQWLNGGTVQNRGIEIQINGTPVKSKNFTWDATVNFGKNRNEILEMPSNLPFFYNSDTWIGNIRNISQKNGSVFDLASNRFSTNTNGDLIISATTGLPLRIFDYTVVGDRQSDFQIGLINNFTVYKNFNVSFNLDLRRGGDVYNGTEEFLYVRGLSKRTLDRETPRVIKGVLADGLQNTTTPTPNNIVVTPLFRSDYYTTGTISQDFIEKDIHWIRLRDITLGYQLPSSLIKKQKTIKSASVFFTGTDLFIITNYTGADPSTNANNTSSRAGMGGVGMDLGNLANPRGMNFGLKIQL